MTTTTVPQVIQRIDGTIQELELLKDCLAERLSDGQQHGWITHSVDHGTIHFFRRNDADDAKRFARALGGEWRCDANGDWYGKVGTFEVCIREADLSKRPSPASTRQRVEL